jgi:hypothetical protein
MLSSFITEALIQAPNPAPVAPPGAAGLGTDIIRGSSGSLSLPESLD